MEIEIITPVKNTEDSGKVRQALLNIFPDAAVEERERKLAGKAGSAENFRDMIKTQRMRDTARFFLKKRVRNGMLSFKLNKQAAYAGKVNFAVVSHPMGEMEVKIKPEEEDENIDEFIEWVTEKEE